MHGNPFAVIRHVSFVGEIDTELAYVYLDKVTFRVKEQWNTWRRTFWKTDKFQCPLPGSFYRSSHPLTPAHLKTVSKAVFTIILYVQFHGEKLYGSWLYKFNLKFYQLGGSCHSCLYSFLASLRRIWAHHSFELITRSIFAPRMGLGSTLVALICWSAIKKWYTLN